jgi:uncharacterized protein (TIGR02599 family)
MNLSLHQPANGRDSVRYAANLSPAFTIVEMLVSTAILGLLMVLLLSTVDQTQRVWLRSSNKVSQFQASRTAFEALTRNLSQATLNTNYGYETDPKTGDPTFYRRESDLHFISGKAAREKLLGSDEKTFPTHAVFFQAPLGWTSEMDDKSSNTVKKYRALNNLLSAVGYYVKWGRDETLPSFLVGHPELVPERYRYRLMEVIQPAESLGIFLNANAMAMPPPPYTKATDWIQIALGKLARPDESGKEACSRVLADNIIALVLLPKLAEQDRPSPQRLDLAPNYNYDTRPSADDGTPKEIDKFDSVEKKQVNQLPPIMQVTMVAIDEATAIRQQQLTGQTAPDFTASLFSAVSNEDDFKRDLGEPVSPAAGSLLYRLQNPTTPSLRISYRVYTSDVVIRGAKWSTR